MVQTIERSQTISRIFAVLKCPISAATKVKRANRGAVARFGRNATECAAVAILSEEVGVTACFELTIDSYVFEQLSRSHEDV